jgi:hypothetical protein
MKLWHRMRLLGNGHYTAETNKEDGGSVDLPYELLLKDAGSKNRIEDNGEARSRRDQ